MSHSAGFEPVSPMVLYQLGHEFGSVHRGARKFLYVNRHYTYIGSGEPCDKMSLDYWSQKFSFDTSSKATM